MKVVNRLQSYRIIRNNTSLYSSLKKTKDRKRHYFRCGSVENFRRSKSVQDAK